jgi:mono/diheme cytochrome c family protein
MDDDGTTLYRAGFVRALIHPAMFAIALGVIACSGGEKSKASAASVPLATANTANIPAIPVIGHPPDGATVQMVAHGDSIFHGHAEGGLCYVCHGTDANGTPLGPSLLGRQWLTGPGTYAFIQQRVTDGMPNQSAPFPSPMPPKGGVPLTKADVMDVSSYVYAISHVARPP